MWCSCFNDFVLLLGVDLLVFAFKISRNQMRPIKKFMLNLEICLNGFQRPISRTTGTINTHTVLGRFIVEEIEFDPT